MNAAGIDVSKGKSMVSVLRPFGEVVAKPFEVRHTASELIMRGGLYMNRVYGLYRVSTTQQLSKDYISMQRQACQEFAQARQWKIVKELYEKRISGFKTLTQDRKVLQQIKKNAELRKFDVLLVFVFDRLGRRDAETPFVVEDIAMHGVETWSVKEGQQCFESHADKRINYIRYWQTSGENLKTSTRIKTRMSQLTEEGLYCCGAVRMAISWFKLDGSTIAATKFMI